MICRRSTSTVQTNRYEWQRFFFFTNNICVNLYVLEVQKSNGAHLNVLDTSDNMLASRQAVSRWAQIRKKRAGEGKKVKEKRQRRERYVGCWLWFACISKVYVFVALSSVYLDKSVLPAGEMVTSPHALYRTHSNTQRTTWYSNFPKCLIKACSQFRDYLAL